jgi:hypothetical protein
MVVLVGVGRGGCTALQTRRADSQYDSQVTCAVCDEQDEDCCSTSERAFEVVRCWCCEGTEVGYRFLSVVISANVLRY